VANGLETAFMSATETLSVTLPEDMVRTIRSRVSAGAYASASEIIGEAMRLWQHREEERAERIVALRARIHRSLADPRPDLDGADVAARLDALHAETLATLSPEEGDEQA
jgi:antitoxin ParD1/3/4